MVRSTIPKAIKTAEQAKRIAALDSNSNIWKIGDRYYVECSTSGVKYIKI